jgi:hypothetical protein
MSTTTRSSWSHDFVLPTLLFAALGGMTWAVRGSSGYGGMAGCIFAGVMWGAAWWFIAREPRGDQSRRYVSGWIVLALTLGIGLSGARGWAQWPNFFDGRLYTNWDAGEFVPISPAYGFVWLFIAGVPWAGIGACLLAWCGSKHRTRWWQWALRIGFGFGAAYGLRYLFDHFPEYFLPLYSSMEERYRDLEANPGLRRLINDSGSAMLHLGFYLGFLLFELVRRDWKNVVLIVTVGLVNGIGWALLQNWKWAADVWPNATFNWWRAWESSGGMSIGIAFGLAYFLVNRRMRPEEKAVVDAHRASVRPRFEWLVIYLGLALIPAIYTFGSLVVRMVSERQTPQEAWETLLGFVQRGGIAFWSGISYFAFIMLFGVVYYIKNRIKPREERLLPDPNLERWGLYLGLLMGLGLSIRNGLKGWANIYIGDEAYWSEMLWWVMGPALFLCLAAIGLWILIRPLPRGYRGDVFPRAYLLVWLVLLVQNVLAQLVTGPLTNWNEAVFNIYYVLLFVITAVIVFHYHFIKTYTAPQLPWSRDSDGYLGSGTEPVEARPR